MFVKAFKIGFGLVIGVGAGYLAILAGFALWTNGPDIAGSAWSAISSFFSVAVWIGLWIGVVLLRWVYGQWKAAATRYDQEHGMTK